MFGNYGQKLAVKLSDDKSYFFSGPKVRPIVLKPEIGEKYSPDVGRRGNFGPIS